MALELQKLQKLLGLSMVNWRVSHFDNEPDVNLTRCEELSCTEIMKVHTVTRYTIILHEANTGYMSYLCYLWIL